MKKNLLFSAVALAVAATAVADETDWVDITPSAYDFANATEIPVIINGAETGAGVWNLGAGVWSKVQQYYNNGLIILNGNGRDNIEAVKNAMSIVDLGGTAGKVFAYTKNDATINEALAEYGVESTIATSTIAAYDHLCWYSDPERTPEETPIRVSMEITFHSEDALMTSGSADGIMKAYINTDQIGVTPTQDDASTAESKKLQRGEFAKRWDEVAKEGRVPEADLDENMENDEGLFEWNPERWLVYEFDCTLPKGDDQVESYGPLFVKMELPGSAGSYTMFIRNIKFYSISENEPDVYDNSRPRVWKYYTVGKSASVDNVAADLTAESKLTFTVNGNDVTFSEGADVYTVAGQKVAAAAAGKAVTLGKGIYVANANGKSVKVAVK